MQQSTDLSLRLVSPQIMKEVGPQSGTIIQPTNVDIPRNPRPHDCVVSYYVFQQASKMLLLSRVALVDR